MLLHVSNDTKLSNSAVTLLKQTLPATWSIRPILPSEEGPDLLISVEDPTGRESIFFVELKYRVEPRDVYTVASQIRRWAGPNAPALIVAPFLSKTTRDLMESEGLSYIDTTGNVKLASDDSGIFIRLEGASKNPVRGERPRQSLRGPITGRVVRFLCDYKPPYGVREIAERTNVNAGNVSRIVDFLFRENLLERSEARGVTEVYWRQLIERWAVDLLKDRVQSRFFEPRGLGQLEKKLQDSKIRYAATSAFAASRLVLVAPPAEAQIFVRDIEAARLALNLEQSARISNVILIEAFDRVAFERTIDVGFTAASPTQIAADLTISLTRDRSEVELFFDWMKENEQTWRR